ncbi:MAG: insulinase family protein, partial [Myxococcota bacterium]
RALANGVPVFILPRRPTSTFDVRLVLRAGEDLDPVGQEGLAAVAVDLADEGAGDLDAAGLAAAIRALGAELTTATQGDVSTIRIRGLSRSLEPALALWADVIRAPTMTEADLAIVRQRRIDRVSLVIREPHGAADRVQAALQWGDGYLGRSPTPVSLAAIDVAAVRSFWTAHVGAGVGAVIAGGDLDPDQLVRVLDAELGAWAPVEPVEPVATPVPIDRETLVFVPVPGAPQAAIRAVFPVGPATDPGRAALAVAVEAVGGAFGSRINLNLREDKGWTYGARCQTTYRAGPGWLDCGSLVRADVAGASVGEMRRELREAVGEAPIGPDEATRFATSLQRAYAVDHETTGALLAEVGAAWVRGLPLDRMRRYLRDLAAVTPSAPDRALRAWLDPDRITWVVAGDPATVRPQLEALGIPIVDRDP